MVKLIDEGDRGQSKLLAVHDPPAFVSERNTLDAYSPLLLDEEGRKNGENWRVT